MILDSLIVEGYSCNGGINKRNSEYGFFCTIATFSFTVAGIDICDASGPGTCAPDASVSSGECCRYGPPQALTPEFSEGIEPGSAAQPLLALSKSSSKRARQKRNEQDKRS